MPTTNLDARIRSIVSAAASEIAKAVRQNIADEVTRLVGGTPAATTPRGRPRKAAPSRGRGRAARAGGASIDAVLAYVKANPGKRTEEISKALGKNAKPALAKLRGEGKVKTKGERRATTYTLPGSAGAPKRAKVPKAEVAPKSAAPK